MSDVAVRPELEPLPRLMMNLTVDKRGYPVPWFVEWVNGEPEFRAMDGRKLAMAIRQRLCWVCGGKLATRFASVAGPMCGINRTSAEPPSHLECARWSARNCPFLSNPNMVRREDEAINNRAFREAAPGLAIARNPGVTMVWITREYELFDPGQFGGPSGILFTMGRPQAVEWYREGRPASRKEVMESMESGLPNLENVARLEPGGIEDLRKKIRAIERWLP